MMVQIDQIHPINICMTLGHILIANERALARVHRRTSNYTPTNDHSDLRFVLRLCENHPRENRAK